MLADRPDDGRISRWPYAKKNPPRTNILCRESAVEIRGAGDRRCEVMSSWPTVVHRFKRVSEVLVRRMATEIPVGADSLRSLHSEALPK